MILKWGGYSHDDNECWFSINRRLVLGQTGTPLLTEERWTIHGVKIASTAAELTTALNELEAAYRDQGRDLVFVDNDGANTTHVLRNEDCLNGTRVIGPVRYPGGVPGVWGSRTEYAGLRYYQITVAGERIVEGLDESVPVVWNESIRYSGGGPKYVMSGAITGQAQVQQTMEQVPVRAVQMGYAEGLYTWPQFPGLLPLGYYNPEESYQEQSSPKQWGQNQNMRFPIRWKYAYDSPTLGAVGPPIGPI